MGKLIHLFTVFTSPPRPPSTTTGLIALKTFYCIRTRKHEVFSFQIPHILISDSITQYEDNILLDIFLFFFVAFVLFVVISFLVNRYLP
jgi:hypothetical protein